MNRLHGVPLLRALPLAELDFLTEQAVFRSYPAGEIIIREGEPGAEFFVIDRGHVRVTQDGAELHTLGAGEFFGEIALLFDVPRTASVSALDECRVLALDGEQFRNLIARQGAFRRALMSVGEERLSTDYPPM